MTKERELFLLQEIKDREDVIEELTEETKKLKELIEIYQKEHDTTFREWQEDIKRFKKYHEYYTKTMDVIEEMIIKLKELNDNYEK